MPVALSPDSLRRAPKVLLHDHLDGGVRPATVVELAERVGYRHLPSTDVPELARWFREASGSGSLERYLETFVHTVAVMQTAEGIARVAQECAEDLAADGVVYAEVRWAPEQHTDRGLSLEEVVDAALLGFRRGEDASAERGHRIRIGALVTAMRHAARSREIAELAVEYRDRGVVGFDIAGSRGGIPTHSASRRLRVPATGELPFHDSCRGGVRVAVDLGGDPVVRNGSAGPRRSDRRRHPGDRNGPALGRLAQYVRDRRIPLEMCPSSNVQTGAAASIRDHPIGLLRRLYFRVTVNTDNRLMSDTSMSREFALLAEAFGYGWADLQWFTLNAMKSAFIPFDQRLTSDQRGDQASLRRADDRLTAGPRRERAGAACQSRRHGLSTARPQRCGRIHVRARHDDLRYRNGRGRLARPTGPIPRRRRHAGRHRRRVLGRHPASRSSGRGSPAAPG